jgi:hypothetical protein
MEMVWHDNKLIELDVGILIRHCLLTFFNNPAVGIHLHRIGYNLSEETLLDRISYLV